MKKFSILKVVLWLKNGKQRVLKFKADKVNVITGHSNTGKTAILDIIDYCFFASSLNISDSVINENVKWYGVLFEINDKLYTLARKHYTNKASSDYYFSSNGEIPEEFPITNNVEGALKLLIETEFSIDSNITISYGGKQLHQGSKISLRYFLMFNTISQDIITESRNIYFDKQNESRYKEALPRIFEIATGIESVNNILLKEKKDSIKKDISLIERKKFKYSQRQANSPEEVRDILRSAREMDLISSEDDITAINELKYFIRSKVFNGNIDVTKRELLEKDRNLTSRKIRNLNIFKNEYNLHKKNLSTIHDSLKPISYLKENVQVRTEYFAGIIDSLEQELIELKKSNQKATPIDRQVTDEILKLNTKLASIQSELGRVIN